MVLRLWLSTDGGERPHSAMSCHLRKFPTCKMCTRGVRKCIVILFVCNKHKICPPFLVMFFPGNTPLPSAHAPASGHCPRRGSLPSSWLQLFPCIILLSYLVATWTHTCPTFLVKYYRQQCVFLTLLCFNATNVLLPSRNPTGQSGPSRSFRRQ